MPFKFCPPATPLSQIKDYQNSSHLKDPGLLLAAKRETTVVVSYSNRKGTGLSNLHGLPEASIDLVNFSFYLAWDQYLWNSKACDQDNKDHKKNLFPLLLNLDVSSRKSKLLLEAINVSFYYCFKIWLV